MIWQEALNQPRILILRTEQSRPPGSPVIPETFTGARQPLGPLLRVCKESYRLAIGHLSTLVPVEPNVTNPFFMINFPIDIFQLQLPELEEFRQPPDHKQFHAYMKAFITYQNERKRNPADESLFVFKPTGSLYVAHKDDDDDEDLLALAPVRPKFPELEIMHNVAIPLTLRPFDFHYGTEDEPDDRPYEDGRGNLVPYEEPPPGVPRSTNVDTWASQQIDEMLLFHMDGVEFLFEGLDNLGRAAACPNSPPFEAPPIETWYFVVGEKWKPSFSTTHYCYKGFWYPKIGVREYLPWNTVDDSSLIYDARTLTLLDKSLKEAVEWTWTHKRNSWQRGRGSVSGGEFSDSWFPRVKFVVADYEGRGQW